MELLRKGMELTGWCLDMPMVARACLDAGPTSQQKTAYTKNKIDDINLLFFVYIFFFPVTYVYQHTHLYDLCEFAQLLYSLAVACKAFS